MGKRRVGFNKKKSGVDALASATGEDGFDAQIEDDLDAMLDDEIDKYNSTKEESSRGKKKSNRKSQDLHPDDEEQEIYPLDISDSDDEDADENTRVVLSGSEIEDDDDVDENDSLSDDDDDSEEDDDEDILGSKDVDSELPDSRAWGRKAKLYHNTDYVDQDFGGFEGADAEQAELEEQEAREIQQRLTAELDEDDFLDFLPPQQEGGDKKGDKGREVLKVDFDNMSVGDKRKFIQRECPELLHLLEEYKDKLQEAQETKELITKDSDAPKIVQEFYKTKYHTILNYCINISYFLYLRASAPNMCKGHPVIKRILQFRRLLEELKEFNVKAVTLDASTSAPEEQTKKTKKVRIEKRPNQKLPKKFSNQPTTSSNSKSFEDLDQNQAAADEENESDKEDQLEKRGITYEMAKNKGLTPARSKLQRNPRVKHRMKFRKATIRRKGQVRTARHEIKKYDGEAFGIKSHLTKSIKLK